MPRVSYMDVAKTTFWNFSHACGGRDRAVGIATRCGVEGPGSNPGGW